MNKRKIVLMAAALCMVAILGFGGTLAYLTDTDQQVNTFTVGNVNIKLDEGTIVYEKDATGADTEIYEETNTAKRTEENQTYKVFPGDTVVKDPTITVEAESEDCYIAAKVVVKSESVTIKGEECNLYDLIGIDGYDTINIKAIVSGGLVGTEEDQGDYVGWKDITAKTGAPVYKVGDTYIAQIADKNSNTWELYIFIDAVKKVGNKIELFHEIEIPGEWNNDQMKIFNGTTIDVSAYAVQANNFEDVYEAIMAAFGDGEFAPVNSDPS